MTDVCVYLIRHGQTFHNIEGRISGQLEAELTPDGIKQAETTAENLQKTGIPYDAILCSPLSRAKNTAAPIAKALGIPVFYDKGLLELNYGKYENVLLEDMFKETYNPPLEQCGVLIHNGRELREYYQNQNPQFDNIRHPGGESKAEGSGESAGQSRREEQGQKSACQKEVRAPRAEPGPARLRRDFCESRALRRSAALP